MNKLKLNELEVGKWYKSENWINNSFAKFLNSNNNYFNYSESIINNKWDEGGGRWGWVALVVFEEVSIEEIRKYLPVNHPDLIENIPVLMENYNYLIPILQKLNIK